MFDLKRFLLLGSIGVSLLAGLMFTTHTTVPGKAFAAGCSPASGRGPSPNYVPAWGDNCVVGSGDTSNLVSAVQEIMDEWDIGECGGLKVDGIFGPATKAAVECFQRRSGFSGNNVDGVVGKQTWLVLGDVVESMNSAGGWDNYATNGPGNPIDFRMWDASGIWYVNVGVQTGTTKWCQMNTSAPCQS